MKLLRDIIFEQCRVILKHGEADGVDIVVDHSRSNVVRFAGFVFHQGVTESDCKIYIRVIVGKKVGVASTNELKGEALKNCLRKALNIAKHIKEEPFQLSLPTGPITYSGINSYFEPTAAMTTNEKVSMLSRGFRAAKAYGVTQSGAFTTTVGELAVLNSKGITAYHPYTTSYLSVVSTRDDGSGQKSALCKDVSDMNATGVMNDSAERCVRASSPRPLEPGAYRVILEPPAVAELVQWLSYIGFGAKSFQEGTSFLSGRLGESVTGDNVTLYDDGLNPLGMSVPFDMEGVPKKKLLLVENGVARGVAYDGFTSALEGRRTTGHSSYPEDTEGPLPGHLFMGSGNIRPSEMIEMLDRGILVKSFHYVNGLINPRDTVMTGMTRHGTFFIDKGRVKHPVHSLRFTENIIKAFERIRGISEDMEVFPNHSFSLSSVAVPYLLIDGFNFTS